LITGRVPRQTRQTASRKMPVRAGAGARSKAAVRQPSCYACRHARAARVRVARTSLSRASPNAAAASAVTKRRRTAGVTAAAMRARERYPPFCRMSYRRRGSRNAGIQQPPVQPVASSRWCNHAMNEPSRYARMAGAAVGRKQYRRSRYMFITRTVQVSVGKTGRPLLR